MTELALPGAAVEHVGPSSSRGGAGGGGGSSSSNDSAAVTAAPGTVVHVDHSVGGRVDAQAFSAAGAQHHGGAASGHRGLATATAVRSTPTAIDSRHGPAKQYSTVSNSKVMTYASYKALRDITRAFLLEPT